jgi:hypothetical protein
MCNKFSGILWPVLVSVMLFAFWPFHNVAGKYNTGSDLYLPNPDTIYQVDTVYQYEYVYDTIYYYDTLPQKDTTFSYSESAENSDTATIVKRTLDVVITENRTIYLDRNNIPQFEGREFREIGDGEIEEVDFKDRDVKASQPKIRKTSKIKPNVKPPDVDPLFVPFERRRRDTLYRFDTVVNYRYRNDTVYFEKRSRSDTVITSRTTYEEFGRSVLVKETVNMKITAHKNVFQDRGSRKNSSFRGFDADRTKRSTKIVPSKYRSSFDRTPRVGKQHTYSGSLKLAGSWFVPEIKYSARNAAYSDQVDIMNDNHTGENSLGVAFTYQYFRDQTGFESGLAFTQNNFSCDHYFQKIVTDTSFYWDYFDRQDFVYDTTWYIDLDYLLQTGDTVFIPNVDSTLIMVPDSTQKISVDSSTINMKEKHNYTFSFLEIPLIAHYRIIDQQFYIDLSAGFIPMFMISKTGKFSYPESDMVVGAEEIDFDYGFMLTFYGSAVFGYKFDNRWSVFVEPHIRRNLFSVVQNNNVHVKINSWGIKAGIAYRLFKIQSK